MATVGTLTVALEADVEGLQEGLNRATALIAEAAKRMEAGFAPVGKSVEGAEATLRKGLTRTAAQADRAGRRMRAGLAPVQEAAEAVEKSLDLRARQQAAILEASRQVLAVEERIAQKEKDMGEILVPKRVKEARERAKELQSAVEEMQAPLRAAQVPEEVVAQMTQRFEEARQRLQMVTEQAKHLDFVLDQVGKTARDFGEKFREALDDLILKGEDLKTVLRGLIEELQNILFRRLVREPVGRLADEIFGGLLSLGGSLLFGGGGAAPWSPPPGEAVIHVPSVADTIGRQFGGPLSPFQPAIVGEAGPELFVPRRAGTVIPNRALATAVAPGPSTVINIDLRGSNGDASIEAAVRRGIARAAPFLINASVETVRDRRARDPNLFGGRPT